MDIILNENIICELNLGGHKSFLFQSNIKGRL